MTAMKPVLDVVIDANVVLLLAFCAWWLGQKVLQMGALRKTYNTQLRLAKLLLVCTMLSPFLAMGVSKLGQLFWPQTPINLGDLAVATYLKGGIAIAPADFEALLSVRSRLIDTALTGSNLWLSGLLTLFCAGALWHVLRCAVSFFRLWRLLSHSHVWRRSRTTDIRLSDQIEVPFAARGLFRRHVVLPSSILTRRADLRIVLPHEFEHLRRGDVEWEMAFELARPFLFWNPAFLLWKRAFDRLRELACDQALLVSRQISPRAYAECLLDYCERQMNRRSSSSMQVALIRLQTSGSRRALAERMIALQYQPAARTGHVTIMAMVVVLGIAVSLSATALRPTGDWSQDRLMLSTIVNLERMRSGPSGF